jgi:hypothetical protein
MKLGADPKKLGLLGGLVALMLAIFYFNFWSSGDSSPAPRAVSAPASGVVAAPGAIRAKGPQTERRRVTNNASLVKDWKPRLGFQNPEDRPDPATVDPTLRLELLAKVQHVDAAAAGRNLFDFGKAPPPPDTELPKTPKIGVTQAASPPPPAGPPGPPPPPAAPQITFKYYGYKVSKSDGLKAAFLLDGDDILIAGENDTVKRRYRVLKIGVNSITIEDTQFKSTQTLPLQEIATG